MCPATIVRALMSMIPLGLILSLWRRYCYACFPAKETKAIERLLSNNEIKKKIIKNFGFSFSLSWLARFRNSLLIAQTLKTTIFNSRTDSILYIIHTWWSVPTLTWSIFPFFSFHWSMISIPIKSSIVTVHLNNFLWVYRVV